VQSVDTEFLTLGSNLLSSQHGSVRRRLITISLDLHTTSDTRDSFTTREISNVNESIVERSKDVSNTEDELTFTNLRTESDLFNNLRGNLLVRLLEIRNLVHRFKNVKMVRKLDAPYNLSINPFRMDFRMHPSRNHLIEYRTSRLMCY
jgi:hypothetical protein